MVSIAYNDGSDSFSYLHSDDSSFKSLPLHIHDSYEIYYFLSGDVTYRIEGQSYKMESNDMLIISDRELHRPRFDSSEAYERIVIHFRPESISLYQTREYNLLQCFQKRKLGHLNKIDAREVVKQGLKDYIDKIESYIQKNLPESHVMIKTLFVQLLVALNNIYIQKDGRLKGCCEYDKKVNLVLDYVNENLHRPITLEMIEKELFISKYYLCHTFKKHTGFTVMEYTAYKKVQKAKALLSEGVSSLEACLGAGFNNYSNFYKTFKKLTGTSPSKAFM